MHLVAVEDAEAGVSVRVEEVPVVTPVELPDPVPEPSPVVVVVLVLVVVLLLDDAGLCVVLAVLVELLALDEEEAGAKTGPGLDVTHLPLIGSQKVLEPSAFTVSVAFAGTTPSLGVPWAGQELPVSICAPELGPPRTKDISHCVVPDVHASPVSEDCV
ncbi:hypothetical protein [Rhodanobacter soli]|uniref:hypothetical protein n=1 Tax=Rhodanobacter soli TaxID=590609 RepID=UPI003390C80C